MNFAPLTTPSSTGHLVNLAVVHTATKQDTPIARLTTVDNYTTRSCLESYWLLSFAVVPFVSSNLFNHHLVTLLWTVSLVYHVIPYQIGQFSSRTIQFSFEIVTVRSCNVAVLPR